VQRSPSGERGGKAEGAAPLAPVQEEATEHKVPSEGDGEDPEDEEQPE
jgi:hypothetical protein